MQLATNYTPSVLVLSSPAQSGTAQIKHRKVMFSPSHQVADAQRGLKLTKSNVIILEWNLYALSVDRRKRENEGV